VAAAVGAFLGELVEAGLLVAGEAEPDPMPAPAPVDRPAPWAAPALETFTDMQELILLDPVHEVEPGQGWPVARPDGPEPRP
jgi:hypothetical protein